ncbi:hypothetical protein RclHR1_00460034 [Rhizophagus clarus]|uniref:Uncharacterized protein n=1 Tax=Rhizophagus clarus TaxID=94130 RepID=A0A2Z6RIG9_9GLOM|nr:hypothetical protein RclHR1_00460034 [Rhizophagus clarus]
MIKSLHDRLLNNVLPTFGKVIHTPVSVRISYYSPDTLPIPRFTILSKHSLDYKTLPGYFSRYSPNSQYSQYSPDTSNTLQIFSRFTIFSQLQILSKCRGHK